MSPDDDYSDSEESRAITIKLSIRIVSDQLWFSKFSWRLLFMFHSKIKFLSRKGTKKSMNFLTPNTCMTSRRKGSLLVKDLLHGEMSTIQIFKSQLILLRNGLITKMKILQAIMSTGVSMDIEKIEIRILWTDTRI